MTTIETNKIRARCWHSISPATANAGEMSVQQLQQFISGTFLPSDDQLEKLSAKLGLR